MNYKELSKVTDAVNKVTVNSKEVQVPTKQELINHFSELAEGLKEDPNWKKTYSKDSLAERESNLGEWETSLGVIKDIYSDMSKYRVMLIVRLYQINPEGWKVPIIISYADLGPSTREWLEQNWESFLEKGSEEIINDINSELLKLKKSSRTPNELKISKALKWNA